LTKTAAVAILRAMKLTASLPQVVRVVIVD